MAHVYIEDIGRHEGEEVTIKGWLQNRRSSGKIHFLILRDGTGFIQAVMSKAAVGDELFKAADHLSQETSVIVTGTARADARAPSGYEIDVKQLEVVGASHDYPITPKEHGVDYLLDRRHLCIFRHFKIAIHMQFCYSPTANESNLDRHAILPLVMISVFRI